MHRLAKLPALAALIIAYPLALAAQDGVLSLETRMSWAGIAAIQYYDPAADSALCIAPAGPAHILLSSDLSRDIFASRYFLTGGINSVRVRRGTDTQDTAVGSGTPDQFTQNSTEHPAQPELFLKVT